MRASCICPCVCEGSSEHRKPIKNNLHHHYGRTNEAHTLQPSGTFGIPEQILHQTYRHIRTHSDLLRLFEHMLNGRDGFNEKPLMNQCWVASHHPQTLAIHAEDRPLQFVYTHNPRFTLNTDMGASNVSHTRVAHFIEIEMRPSDGSWLSVVACTRKSAWIL